MGSNDGTPAALLTNAQRDWLRGEKDYSPSAERDVRSRLRERVYTTLTVDVPLLTEELDADYRQQIAESFGPDNTDRYGGGELASALRSQVAFAYQLARAGGLDADQIVREGAAEGKADRLDVLHRRFQEGDTDLTVAELDELVQAGRISDEERREFVTSHNHPVGYISAKERKDEDIREILKQMDNKRDAE